MVRRNLALCLVILGLIAVTCSSSSDSPTEATATNTVTKATMAEPANDTAPTPGSTPSRPRVAANIDPASIPSGQVRYFGPAPKVPTGDLAPATAKAIDTLLGEQLLRFVINQDSFDAISTLGQSEDPRVAWWLADLMRIAPDPDLTVRLSSALHELLGVEIDPLRPWDFTTNHLMGWDIPAPPDYLTYKRNTYIVREPKWEPLFEDGSDIDWRLISWGGVFIDDRAFNMTDNRCNCIPAADNPITTSASGGDEWLDEDAVIFGISINGEHRAYPRSIMEVREMVNDTLGGRDFAMPYCTLCGSAQVFFTDEVPAGFARPVLRTSGLLNRSNKVMFDVTTFSIFDTFLGQAVSGPLGDAGVELNQHSVITTTWGRWKTDDSRTHVVGLATECSPKHLNIVLVDFKGGGAFDVVRDLPHVVGMITDLDEVLVARALVSLRTGRTLRKTRRTTERRGNMAGMVNIAERPAEADDRAVPGHWEGDLITGKENKSAIGTLVERSTGYLLLLHLPDRHGADDVETAMIETMSQLPETLRRTLTWDQGNEMANHVAIADAAELDIYFCDPHSPWQRGTNENTNGLLRQYFPKSTDLSGYHRDYLDFVAAQLNNWPRKRLEWHTPAEALDQLLSEEQNPPGVATTS
jgi:hypothetical protein